MSQVLKNNILSVGQLEEQIYQAINFFGCEDGYVGPDNPCDAQRLFSQRLANAISDAVSKGVQQYLASTVKTINTNTLVNTGTGVAAHVHPNVPQYDLLAP